MNARERLEKIMEAEGLNVKQFCKEVGISQSTMSNIKGGRNNPSLDVMQAVLNRFRTIQSDWLILGIGSMYRPNGDGPQTALFDVRPNDKPQSDNAENDIVNGAVNGAVKAVNHPVGSNNSPSAASGRVTDEKQKNDGVTKQVKRIIVFYTDGTYEER